jgi:hypothetical protein
LEDLSGRKALLPEGADGQRVMALGEAGALLVGKELGVEVCRRWKVEGVLEKDLAGGGFEEIAAADYFGDLHCCVVDHAGELVAGKTGIVRMVAKGFSPNEEVAEVFACGEGLGAEVLVCETDDGSVGNAKAVVDVVLEGRFVLRHIRSRAADTGVYGFVVWI